MDPVTKSRQSGMDAELPPAPPVESRKSFAEMRKGLSVLDLYIDADACPVKQEICRVAKRYHLNVTFVSNARMRIPEQAAVRLVVVGDQFDAADQWIVEHISRDDIVVTTDRPPPPASGP